MSKNDPYNDNKKYHMFGLMNDSGGVSALCFKRPKPIDLNKALWTIDRKAVTCKKCLAMIKEEIEA